MRSVLDTWEFRSLEDTQMAMFQRILDILYVAEIWSQGEKSWLDLLI